MHVHKTDIEGVFIFEPTVYQDARGYFYESFRKDVYASSGIQESFVQDSVSYSHHNVLRGLHVSAQGKLVSVLKGTIFDVAVDVRPGSPTFRKHVCVELSDQNHRQLYIPPGLGHGFYVLSSQALVCYKVSSYYDPRTEHTVLWNDQTLCIPWPAETPTLSKRDAIASPLNYQEG